MQKPKVAIIRGPGLSKWEMQIYEPLSKWFDLTGIGTKNVINDISDISFSLILLPLKWNFFKYFPWFTRIMPTIFGDTQWLEKFNEAVEEFDILHSVELRNGFTLQSVMAKRLGLAKVVTVTVYENIPFIGDEYPKRKYLKEQVIPYIDHFFAANEIAKQTLIAEGVDKNIITLIPQSVDTSRFSPNSSQRLVRLGRKKLKYSFGIQEGDFVVLAAGRMVWEKGWYDIVRTAYIVHSSQSVAHSKRRIVFLCVGDGPELDSLKKTVKQLNLEKVVIFTGNIPYQEMPEIFRLGDVFVQASLPTRNWNEQFGGVLIEAMATGLPIVGTLNGGIYDTVGKKGGIFVAPQDFTQLTQAILDVFLNKKVKIKMGNHNFQKAKKLYDNHVVAINIKNIWEKLLKS